MDSMFQLHHDIVQVLCKFEMIFPPAFFTSMMHVMVHLPEEALLAGPVNYRWMYPIERLLGELKKSVRNRAKPGGSIKRLGFNMIAYFLWNVFKRCRDGFQSSQRNNDGGMRNEKLSVFAQSARPFESWTMRVVNKLKSSNSPTYSDELYNLAFGPIRTELFSGCKLTASNFWGCTR
ncbi:hypothetical protein Prudu_019157 [Prunus dulcis]|uniref:DUF4218 domain-containing protein n=1 Tax=Prunus dulcis TaxID=3755 RepID=A0A4Y1RU09_PRUDU|nr:hypothetical protein Prudu_019157 [Prunus dulcis]